MRAFLILFLLCAAGNAFELKGRLKAGGGQASDYEGSVVWLDEGEKFPHPAYAPSLHVMNQVDKAFSPKVLVIKKGDQVRFDNLDNVFHNVFSFDKRNRFDLGLFKGAKHFSADLKTELHDSSATIRTFIEDGKIYVFCNIHPDMVGAIYIFDHGYYAQADKDGLFTLPLPSTGTFALSIDGPRLDKAFKTTVQAVSGAAPVALSLPLRPSAKKVAHTQKNGAHYPSEGSPY